jgi:small subunit ribosomal protein S17
MASGLRERTGVVVSNKMDKTVVVAVKTLKVHRLYRKAIRRTQRYKAHDVENACHVGDEVVIRETRPLSKDKRWRIVQILARHELIRSPQPEEEIAPDIAPAVAESTALAAAPTAVVESEAPAAEPAVSESEVAAPEAEAVVEEAEAEAQEYDEEGLEPALVEATPTSGAESAEEMAEQAELEADIPEAEVGEGSPEAAAEPLMAGVEQEAPAAEGGDSQMSAAAGAHTEEPAEGSEDVVEADAEGEKKE